MDIGLINRGHRKKILVEIEKLPPEEMDQEVPVSFLPTNSVIFHHGRIEHVQSKYRLIMDTGMCFCLNQINSKVTHQIIISIRLPSRP